MRDQRSIDKSRDRIMEQIDEILRIRGAQDCLNCEEDVVLFAVEELHQKTLKSRAAELDRLLVWRQNFEVKYPGPSQKKFCQVFPISAKKPVLVSAAGTQGNSPKGRTA